MALGSPFLDRELLVAEVGEEAAPRAAALAGESPFADEAAGGLGLFEGQGGLTGDDDRREVGEKAIVDPPYEWICAVTYEKDGRTLDGGTGVLISKRHVLTARHVITDAGSGPNAPDLVVYPGRHFKGQSGRFLAARTRVSAHRRLDFGLITLNEDVDLAFWPAADLWSDALLPLQQLRKAAVPITTAGYPDAKDRYRRRMYVARGHTERGSVEVIFRHTADTTRGQSGSPIWVEPNGRRVLLGIVTGYDCTGQLGLRLDPSLVRAPLDRWMAEDAREHGEREVALEVEEVEAGEPEVDEELPTEALADEDAAESEDYAEEDRLRADEADAEPQQEEDAPKVASPSSGKWLAPLAVKETTIPKYVDSGDKPRSTGCAIYLPAAAAKVKAIDLLVFIHGDARGCLAAFDQDPASPKKFGLDTQIEASGRAVALAVPQMFWRRDDVSQIKGKWSAAPLNQFIDDVLAEIARQTSLGRTLDKLILAAHSRAYHFLTPLALEFHRRVAATASGALARLAEVWSLDANYDVRHIHALDAWASAYPRGRFVAVHSPEEGHADRWAGYYKEWGLPPSLKGCLVRESHCVIPTKYVKNLLLTDKDSPKWCEP